jgi:hypothetical protein
MSMVSLSLSRHQPGLTRVGWVTVAVPTLLAHCHHFGRLRVALWVSWVYILGKGLLAGCLRVAENGLHSAPALVATIHGFTVTKAGCRWHPLPLRVWDISCLFRVLVWAPHGWHRVGTHTEASTVSQASHKATPLRLHQSLSDEVDGERHALP